MYRGQFHEQPVALKVFHQDHDPLRMDREAQILRGLECPHVVRLLDVDSVTIDGAPCALIAYEFLPGGDLRQFLEHATPLLPVQSLLKIGQQIGCGIECMWKERCVHRDIKPANIIQASDGRFVLVDVAFALHLDLTQATATGLIVGTQGYLSPEQERGRRKLTVHSDVFSLGVTLYQLATRQRPFPRLRHPGPAATIVPIDRIRNDMPFAATRLIEEMLSFAPAKRPANVSHRFEELMEPE